MMSGFIPEERRKYDIQHTSQTTLLLTCPCAISEGETPPSNRCATLGVLSVSSAGVSALICCCEGERGTIKIAVYRHRFHSSTIKLHSLGQAPLQSSASTPRFCRRPIFPQVRRPQGGSCCRCVACLHNTARTAQRDTKSSTTKHPRSCTRQCMGTGRCVANNLDNKGRL